VISPQEGASYDNSDEPPVLPSNPPLSGKLLAYQQFLELKKTRRRKEKRKRKEKKRRKENKKNKEKSIKTTSYYKEQDWKFAI
jgi:hypothetical protein